MNWIVGVDEVGRGPLAGPVTAGVISFRARDKKLFNKEFKGVRDSKKLSEKGRVAWLAKLKQFEKKGLLRMGVSSVGEKTIDRKGIVFSVHRAIARSLSKIQISPDSRILLDGGIHAPKEFKNQKTIIRGDEKEKIIALASIIAKVSRDRKMKRLSKKFPQYGFAINKGYGTAFHIRAIKKKGLSAIHRRSFCKGIY